MSAPALEEKLAAIERRFEGLAAEMADPGVLADQRKYQAATKAYSELQPVVEALREQRRTEQALASARQALEEAGDDPEVAELAREEIGALTSAAKAVEERLRALMLPKDPNDDKDVILEIRAGTGGDEATLFADELLRMYLRYAESRRWNARVVSRSDSGAGGIKEAIVEIEGKGAYSRLKHESGVHRVQRVPATEASGRIHTSAASVAVLPEAEEVEVDLPEKDLRIDTFCSSGPGGQSVNTTSSAIRITNIPTGLIVQCQDEKSQHKNKASALKVLRARLQERARQEQHDAIAADRKSMVGSGDRSEKIRTYNFPQGRVTDHRVPVTIHRIGAIMDGDLDVLLDPLVSHFEARRLEGE